MRRLNARRGRPWKKYLFAAAFSLLVFLLPLNSQQPLVGLIQGTVMDQQQAPIPCAGCVGARR